MADKKRPEWAPANGGEGFASFVLPGEVTTGKEALCPRLRRRELCLDDYVSGVLARDRTILGRAITLVESNAPAHLELAREMLKRLLPHAEKSIRVGVTGVPGAGKSTLIETLGNLLCDQGHRVAVLAVDPSSSLSKGSILGDKTRMERLARRESAFIRPSPSGGVLGGVARKSRETLLVCEAAGFDVILVETVGVGQSESTVRSMVDFFLLVLIAGAGDELQGLKRGVMELCDAVLVNKADGENEPRALAARAEFEQVLHYLAPSTPGWTTRALACSAKTGQGVPEVWATVEGFVDATRESGAFEERRRTQNVGWMHAMLEEYLRSRFLAHPAVRGLLPEMERAVASREISPAMAVARLVECFGNARD